MAVVEPGSLMWIFFFLKKGLLPMHSFWVPGPGFELKTQQSLSPEHIPLLSRYVSLVDCQSISQTHKHMASLLPYLSVSILLQLSTDSCS